MITPDRVTKHIVSAVPMSLSKTRVLVVRSVPARYKLSCGRDGWGNKRVILPSLW